MTTSPLSEDCVSSLRAESSSKHMTSTPTSPSSVWIEPSVAINVVRWNPLVLEPSTTVLRIACRKGTGFAPIIAEIVKAVSTAFES